MTTSANSTLTRRQAITAGIVGTAAGVLPATGNATLPAAADLNAALDGLPEWLQVVVHVKRMQQAPVEDRRGIVAKLRRDGFPEDSVEHFERLLSLQTAA